ncbi:uncharacterized protein RCC_05231 [Ramularia collo-cygni]|uniref:Uncharacterized protein n=1 Tax=Ramularia collo-cygni TaxID=112498 RepID=A0A2D3VFF5_9PEZI|nr:uncharacterized protein RCC_05231 [Ramularia collo-cygni]CZT19383.1 uncharacterized protein RCC_05231 [Ramularia collo-cygni]
MTTTSSPLADSIRSAASKVFDILELFEMILVWTAEITIREDQENIRILGKFYRPRFWSSSVGNGYAGEPVRQLFVLQRTSKTFQASIRGSIPIRRRMFLEYYPRNAPDMQVLGEGTREVEHMTPLVWFAERVAFKGTDLVYDLVHKPSWKSWQESSTPGFHLTPQWYKLRHLRPGAAWMHPKASWREMKMCCVRQRRVWGFTCELDDYVGFEMTFTRKDHRRKDWLTLGELQDWLTSMVSHLEPRERADSTIELEDDSD